MKPLASIIVAILVLVGRQASAEINCYAITAFDRLRHAEVRLAQYQTPTRFITDRSIVAAELNYLRQTTIADALGSGTLADERKLFAEFLQNAEALLVLLNNERPDQVSRYLNQDHIQRNLRELSVYLNALPCNVQLSNFDQQNSSGSDPTQNENTANPAELVRSLVEKANVLQFFILLVCIAGAIVGQRAIVNARRRYKRRAKRYSANYATTYRQETNAFPGVLLDISGRGTKLRHDQDNAAALNTIVEVEVFGDWVRGKVAWNNAHYTGVQFDKPLRQKVVRRIHKGDSATPVGPA